MAKVICDVCGTAYPDTASQCPICGSAKTTTDVAAAEAAAAAETTVKTHVKGGRFSTANVRKRNRAAKKEEVKQAAPVEKPKKEKKEKSNRPLVILLIVLLLALLAVMAYIWIRFFLPSGISIGKPAETTATNQSVPAEPSTQETDPPTEQSLACTGITLSDNVIDFAAAGRAWLLNASAEPSDTTDTITYESSDESVATVSDKGRVTAVGPGQAVITVRCGEVTAECRIVCSFETAPTEPSGSEGTEPVDENKLTLDRDDITFSKKGETFRFDTGSINASQITWTSDNEAVCIVVNGLATAVGHGTTEIHAEYEGQTVSCIIRCSFTEDGKTGKVTTDSLNIRSAPSTSANAVGYYVKGDKVVVYEEKTGDGLKWGRTDKGWICLDYISFD